MVEELGIVVGREVSAIVSTPAFFAGQSGAGDEKGKSVKILSFMRAPGLRMGHARSNLVELIERESQSLSGAHDTYITPHQVLNFANNFFGRSADWAVGGGTARGSFAGRCSA